MKQSMEIEVLEFVARMSEVDIHQVMDEFYFDDYSRVSAFMLDLSKRGVLSVRTNVVSRRKNMYSITNEGRAKIRLAETNEYIRVES